MATVPDESGVEEGAHMTIWEHLAELRKRLIICAVAVGICMVGAYFLWDWMLDIARAPYCRIMEEDCQLYAPDPLEPFRTRLRVSLYAGVILAMPVLLWQVWGFVTPGLYAKEKRYAVPFVAASLVLFIMGATAAYLALGQALEFLINAGGPEITPIPSVDRYLNLVVWMMLGFGIGFEFPVLLVALQLIGLLHHSQLVHFRRYAIVLIMVVAAFITPSGDPVTLILLWLPMYLLYEASIGIGWFIQRRRRKAEAAQTTAGGDDGRR
ncbi:MAG: twin-arginine translocase subunit TatC [Acidimicrobiia bacterium]|nr:twin-arginine translocase subunit TatC [Acidimicrobiia bacterium]